MGRTYWYECGRCGYRAKVSGKADRGVNFHVQTIHCRDCKRLYDAVTRLRVPEESQLDSWRNAAGLRRLGPGLGGGHRQTDRAPAFQLVLNQLPHRGAKHFKWLHFKPQCPVSALHKIEKWNDPGHCPRCALLLERTTLPYRLWD